MALNQARQQGLTGQLQGAGAGRGTDFIGGAGLHNFVALHQHGPAGVAVLAVEDGGRAQQQGRSRRGSRARLGQQGGRKPGQNPQQGS